MKIRLYKILAVLTGIAVLYACKEEVPEIIPVQFSDAEASNITEFSAQLSSSLTKLGNQEITDHGFAISTDGNEPKVDEKSIKKGALDIALPAPVAFSGALSGLEANTGYRIRPYAITPGGTSFGNTITFKTLEISQPAIKTNAAESVTHNTAKLNGSVTAKGTHAISEYGLVWHTSPNPTTALASKTSVKANITQFPFNFSANAGDLQADTEYHFRAYVIMNGTTTYGADLTFKTSVIKQPGITTGDADNITTNSARLAGSVTQAGTYPITERGVVWATSANPTTASAKASIAGNVTTFPTNYTVNAGSLAANTTYNYRAYVIMNGVTTYGPNKTFQTNEVVQLPGIRTDESKAATNEAYLVGTLTAKGSHAISEYGICWGSAPNPTTSGSKESFSGNVTAFPKQFNATARGLNPASTYHYRAYVIMNGITAYGEDKTFTTTLIAPVVTTGDVFSISGRGTVITGTVNSQGSFPITEIGIVYGPAANPTTSNTKLSKSGSGITFPHNYDFNIQGGFGGTGAVYFRAYVVAQGQTYYGSSKVARAAAPVLATGSSTLTGSTYTLRGTINSAGTYPIREYGIVWAISNNTPTTAHNKLTLTGNPSVPVNFTRTLSIGTIGNCRGVTYRAYAITTDGTTHYAGSTGSFSTPGCVN